jgi:hypothetical protein
LVSRPEGELLRAQAAGDDLELRYGEEKVKKMVEKEAVRR